VRERRQLTIWVVLGISLLTAASTAAAVSAVATVDRNRIGLTESILLSVTAGGENPRIDISGIVDFEVLPRGRQSSISVVNNQMSRQTVFRFALIPNREGSLQIPEIPVTDGEETTLTRAIPVLVTSAPTTTSPQEGIMVGAQVSDNQPYVGEQITYTFRLSSRIRFANARFQKPGFKGFSVHAIDAQKQYDKLIAGQQYRITELRYVLIPLQSGETTIDPAELTCDVPANGRGNRPGQTGRFFGGGARLSTRVYRTPPLVLTIKPLPPYRGDLPFSGLVGEFSLDATLDPTDVAVGDSATVTLTLSGTGNIFDAGPPTFTLPEAFKSYDDIPEDDIALNDAGFSGKKVFRTALVPTVPGDLVIPSASVVVFDTGIGEYKLLQTRPFTITAMAGSALTATPESGPSPAPWDKPLKKTVTLVGRDLLPLKTDAGALKTVHPPSPRLFGVLAAMPVLFYLSVVICVSRFRSKAAPRKKMADRARRALKQAEVGDAQAQLPLLKKSLTAAVFYRAGGYGEALTYEEIAASLTSKDVPESLIAEACAIMRAIDALIYGGAAADEKSAGEFLKQAKPLIKELLQ
jgi:hypothetical protein